MSAFKDFVNANLGIRKVLVSDFGPPIGPGKSDTASGPIGSQYIDLNTGPNYILYEKIGPNNDTDWVEIRKVGEAGAKPHEPNYSVQFASGDKLGGSSNLTYNYDTNLLKGVSGEFDTFKVLGDLHVLGTSYVHEVKDTTIEGTISGYTGKFTDLLVQDKNILDLINGISGNLISTGSFLESEINTLSGESTSSFLSLHTDITATGQLLSEDLNTLSGESTSSFLSLHTDITATGQLLSEDLNSISGESTSSFLSLHTDITATGQLLSEDLNSISGELSDDILYLKNDSIATFAQQEANLNSTGYLLQKEIDTVSGNLISTGSFLESEINTLSGESTSSFLSLHTDITATGQLLLNSINNFSNSSLSRIEDQIDSLSGDLNTTGLALSKLSGDLINLESQTLASLSQQSLDLIATGQLLDSAASESFSQIDALSGNLISTGVHLLGGLEFANNDISSISGDLINLESQTLASLSQQSLDLIATGQLLSSNLNGASSDDINAISGDLINLESQTLASFAQQSSELSATGQLLNSDIHLLSGTLQNSINLSSGNATANSIALFDDTHILEDRLELVSGESLANIISVSDDITILKDDTDREFIIHSGQNLADHILLSMDIFDVAKKIPNLSSLPIPANTNFMAIEYGDVSNIIKYQFIPQVSTSVRIDANGNNQVYASSVYNVSDTGFYVKFNPQVIESNNFLDISVTNKA